MTNFFHFCKDTTAYPVEYMFEFLHIYVLLLMSNEQTTNVLLLSQNRRVFVVLGVPFDRFVAFSVPTTARKNF